MDITDNDAQDRYGAVYQKRFGGLEQNKAKNKAKTKTGRINHNIIGTKSDKTKRKTSKSKDFKALHLVAEGGLEPPTSGL